MNRYLLILFLMLSGASNSFSQEITETNTDKLYELARKEYWAGNFTPSLKLTQKGLELAPDYHDIRILQVRLLWALERFPEADKDLRYLMKKAPDYPDVPPLVHQRVNRFKDPQKALDFLEKANVLYPQNISLQVKRTELLLKTDQQAEARYLAQQLIEKDITGAERYLLQTVLNRTVKNRMGLNYQYIGFNEDYSNQKPWSTFSLEYQRNMGSMVVLGRTTFADRRYDNGMLYEIEAYPVFNDRFYSFANIGFSNTRIFPDFQSSFSLYYNFAKIFEAEGGSRLQAFGSNKYLTVIGGLTAYIGKFYLNSRIFLGPEREGKLLQNYQFNTRFYLKNAENYLFLRLGSGISPDETSRSTLLLEDPTLEAWYSNVGINTTLGFHHMVKAGIGLLHEDITAQRSGTQFSGNIGYYYNF